MISEKKGAYVVRSKGSRKAHGYFPDRASALAQSRAIYLNANFGAGKRVPRKRKTRTRKSR